MAWKLKRTKSGEDEPKTKGLKPREDEETRDETGEEFEHMPDTAEPVVRACDPELNHEDRTVMLLNDEDFLPGLIPSSSDGAVLPDFEHGLTDAPDKSIVDDHDKPVASAHSADEGAVTVPVVETHVERPAPPVDDYEAAESSGEWDLDAFAPYQPPDDGGEAEVKTDAVVEPQPEPVIVVDAQVAPVGTAKLVVSLGQFSASYEIVKAEVTIGRPDPRVNVFPDVSIEWDDAVSRNHARVLHQEDGDYVEDVGSTNGTKLNGNPLIPNKSYLLKNGDQIQLGEKSQITYAL